MACHGTPAATQIYPTTQIPGRVRLEGDALKEYNNLRAHLLQLLEDPESACSKYLKDKVDVTGGRIARTVVAQRAFDGDRSSISMGDAGLLPRRGTYTVGGIQVSSTDSVSSFFARRVAVGNQAGYARASTGATQHDVYYAPGLFSEATILHEALHTLLGGPGDDPELDRRGADVAKIRVKPQSPSAKNPLIRSLS